MTMQQRTGAVSRRSTQEHLTITAAAVHAAAVARYGEDNVGARELGETYESMLSMMARQATGVFYTPREVARPMTALALGQAIRRVDPRNPEALLRILVCDPACGAGIFLVEAAVLLATNYAGRLFGRQPTPEQMSAVLPTVILSCIFGVDVDPVAAELARLALSLETAGTLPADALVRHVVCGNTLAGDSPPALEERLAVCRVVVDGCGGDRGQCEEVRDS